MTKHLKRPLAKKVGGLLAATLLFNAAASGGESTSSKAYVEKEVAPPLIESNPLCLLGGAVCFDVEERLRLEIRSDNFDFADSVNVPTDDTFLLQRFRIGLLVKPSRWFRFYLQGQDSREIDSDRPNIPFVMGAEGDDNFDLLEAWVEFSNYEEFPLGVRIGRQGLKFGDQRLVGTFEWNNFSRRFDAIRVTYQAPNKKATVDLFAGSVVNIYRDEFNKSDLFNGNETNRDQLFGGLYASTKPFAGVTAEFYGFYLHQNESQLPNPPNDDTNFATLGTLIKLDPAAFHGWEFDTELAGQQGEVRGQRLTAGAAHVGLGYNWLTAPWKPRIYAQYNYATGDQDAADDTIETFQNLFPTNHLFYGYIDAFSWQNLSNPSLTFQVSPCQGVVTALTGHAFFLATNEDAAYRANGVATIRGGRNPDASTFVGTELDFTTSWKVNKYVSLLVGYSHFFAGDYLADTGPRDDADFAYFQTEIKF